MSMQAQSLERLTDFTHRLPEDFSFTPTGERLGDCPFPELPLLDNLGCCAPLIENLSGRFSFAFARTRENPPKVLSLSEEFPEYFGGPLYAKPAFPLLQDCFVQKSPVQVYVKDKRNRLRCKVTGTLDYYDEHFNVVLSRCKETGCRFEKRASFAPSPRRRSRNRLVGENYSTLHQRLLIVGSSVLLIRRS